MFLLPHNTSIEGHLKIWDDDTKEILLDKRNAINPENFSVAFAESIGGQRSGIYELHFGSGGTTVSTKGKITYNKPITVGGRTSLYSPTFFKVVNVNDTLNNTNPAENYITTEHTTGNNYTDIVVNALLDYYDPELDSTIFITAPTTAPVIIPTQAPLANSNNFDGAFIFDEIGLKSKGEELNTGLLLTHIIFSPIQKAQNRRFRIQYTVRVRIGAEMAPIVVPEGSLKVTITPNVVSRDATATITITGGAPNQAFTYSGSPTFVFGGYTQQPKTGAGKLSVNGTYTAQFIPIPSSPPGWAAGYTGFGYDFTFGSTVVNIQLTSPLSTVLTPSAAPVSTPTPTPRPVFPPCPTTAPRISVTPTTGVWDIDISSSTISVTPTTGVWDIGIS